MGALTLPRPKLRPWRRLSVEPVGSYRILEVCRVELEDAERRARGDAFTIRCNDWCNVVAVTPDDHVVLVWQYRFGTDAISLEVPGGVVDAGETPEQAARRELLEETGYRARDLESLLVVEPNPAVQHNRCFTFVAHDAVPTGTTCFDSQEELETVVVPAGRIGDLLEGGQVTHALVRGALEAYRRRRDDALLPQATTWAEVEQLLDELEEQQRCRVLELARRLRPGLTLEDLRNPHDFRELDDRDWQYEDGVFAGVQSVLAAVRARGRERKGRT